MEFQEYLRWFILVLFVSSAIFSLWYHEWVYVFISIVAIVLLVYSNKIRRKGMSFSSGLHLVILLFVYAAIFLGELGQFYLRFWWWDIVLHSFSAAVLGLLGLAIVYFLNNKAKHSNLSPLFVAMFGFSFAITIGVIWEIFEFCMDYLLGFNMQKSGIVDTMTDLIVNAVVAFVVASWGYVSLKGNFRKTFDFFKKMIVVR